MPQAAIVFTLGVEIRLVSPYGWTTAFARFVVVIGDRTASFRDFEGLATIEFLQQEWINEGDFIGAGNERDPIVGRQEEGATFTIPKEPVRRRLHGIETFNVLKGGEYFFLPSLSALNWLANQTGG